METTKETVMVGALAELQAKMCLAFRDTDPDDEMSRIDLYRSFYFEMPEDLRREFDEMDSSRVKALSKRALVSLMPVAEA